MSLVGGKTPSGKIHAIPSVGEDSNEGTIQFLGLVRRHEDHASLGNGRSRFGARIGNYWKAARNTSDGTAAARRNVAANKKENIAQGKVLNNLKRFHDAFHR